MRIRSALALSAGLLALLAAAPAPAQTPMDDPLDARDARRVDRMEKVVRELRSIVFQARDTGRPVVVQPAETDFQVQELTRRVSDLEQTLTRLNGALETTGYELSQARREIQALQAQNRDLSDRLAALEQGGAAPIDSPPPPPVAADPAVSAADAFASARQLMLNGDYDRAERAFREYVARYGDSPRTPEANYWLGKTLSVRSAHADAVSAYVAAIRNWPQTGWAPDAVVELARALIALKQPAQACQTLAELPKRYPKPPAAVATRAAAARTQAKCDA